MCVLTGPAECEFAGTLRSATGAWSRDRKDARLPVAVETLTFGCRLNTYESEVMQGRGRKGRAARRA